MLIHCYFLHRFVFLRASPIDCRLPESMDLVCLLIAVFSGPNHHSGSQTVHQGALGCHHELKEVV